MQDCQDIISIPLLLVRIRRHMGKLSIECFDIQGGRPAAVGWPLLSSSVEM